MSKKFKSFSGINTYAALLCGDLRCTAEQIVPSKQTFQKDHKTAQKLIKQIFRKLTTGSEGVSASGEVSCISCESDPCITGLLISSVELKR